MIADWAKGYEAAVRDMRALAASRGLMTPGLDQLFTDLTQDAAVIDHALHNRHQRQRLRAKQEELPIDR